MGEPKKIIFDKGLLRCDMFTNIDLLSMPFLANDNCVVYGIFAKEKCTSAGIININHDHIFISHIVGDFLEDGHIHDNLIGSMCRALGLRFISICPARRGVEKVLKSRYNFKTAQDGEVMKYV